MDISKNDRAKEIMGLRGNGTPLFMPHELGYSCPICGAEDEVNLEWSEYHAFIWCRRCNLDIPSCLCEKYGEPMLGQDPLEPRERVELATKIFLDSVESVKKRRLGLMDKIEPKMYVTQHKKYKIGKLSDRHTIIRKEGELPFVDVYNVESADNEVKDRQRAFLIIDLLEKWDELEEILKIIIGENIVLDLTGKLPELHNANKRLERIFYYLLNEY